MATGKFLAIGMVIKRTSRRGLPLAKVRVPKMSLDVNLLMYFPKKRDFWCSDKKEETIVGDIVTIKDVLKSSRKLVAINHKIDSIVYKCGAVVDPVTGRRCRGTQFVDEEARKTEISQRRVEDLKVTKIVEV